MPVCLLLSLSPSQFWNQHLEALSLINKVFCSIMIAQDGGDCENLYPFYVLVDNFSLLP